MTIPINDVETQRAILAEQEREFRRQLLEAEARKLAQRERHHEAEAAQRERHHEQAMAAQKQLLEAQQDVATLTRSIYDNMCEAAKAMAKMFAEAEVEDTQLIQAVHQPDGAPV